LASDEGRDVLRVMSYLVPAPVPLHLIRASSGSQESNAVEDRTLAAIRDLVRLSLVECDGTDNPPPTA
jgi:hypothetical protein